MFSRISVTSIWRCLSPVSRSVSSVPVNCHNEWDPLEEIIVGRLEGACVPPLTTEVKATLSKEKYSFFSERGGGRFPTEHTKKAVQEVENFCSVLESEGVKVHRPEVTDFQTDYKTPDFYSPVGLYNAMPRDFMVVVGDEIIEAPMAWRCRFFEYRSYRPLFKKYFSEGAKWTAAPKPLMSDELYDETYPDDSDQVMRLQMIREGKYATTEFEPCFDAADFLRAGKDIFAHRSHVTNYSGIEWMRRHLGDKYTVHNLCFDDPYAIHIDTSIVLLKPGLVVLNPERVLHQREFFEKAGWKIVNAPKPNLPKTHPMWVSSPWLTLNSIMLDENRIVVEKGEEELHKFYEDLGLKCIKVPFTFAYSYGGGFHCYTSEIKRRGDLQSYF